MDRVLPSDDPCCCCQRCHSVPQWRPAAYGGWFVCRCGGLRFSLSQARDKHYARRSWDGGPVPVIAVSSGALPVSLNGNASTVASRPNAKHNRTPAKKQGARQRRNRTGGEHDGDLSSDLSRSDSDSASDSGAEVSDDDDRFPRPSRRHGDRSQRHASHKSKSSRREDTDDEPEHVISTSALTTAKFFAREPFRRVILTVVEQNRSHVNSASTGPSSGTGFDEPHGPHQVSYAIAVVCPDVTLIDDVAVALATAPELPPQIPFQTNRFHGQTVDAIADIHHHLQQDGQEQVPKGQHEQGQHQQGQEQQRGKCHTAGSIVALYRLSDYDSLLAGLRSALRPDGSWDQDNFDFFNEPLEGPSSTTRPADERAAAPSATPAPEVNETADDGFSDAAALYHPNPPWIVDGLPTATVNVMARLEAPMTRPPTGTVETAADATSASSTRRDDSCLHGTQSHETDVERRSDVSGDPMSLHESLSSSWTSRLHPAFTAALRPHQRRNIDFALRRNGRCIIADEMGTGKSCQALAIVAALDAWPAVVVCPASVRAQWAVEAEKWLGLDPRDITVIYGGLDVPGRRRTSAKTPTEKKSTICAPSAATENGSDDDACHSVASDTEAEAETPPPQSNIQKSEVSTGESEGREWSALNVTKLTIISYSMAVRLAGVLTASSTHHEAPTQSQTKYEKDEGDWNATNGSLFKSVVLDEAHLLHAPMTLASAATSTSTTQEAQGIGDTKASKTATSSSSAVPSAATKNGGRKRGRASTVAQRTEVCLALCRQCPHALLLTGTPLLSRPVDAFYLVDAVSPGLLGPSPVAFAQDYCCIHFSPYISVPVSHREEELRAVLSLVMTRVSKEEAIGSKLPSKFRHVINVPVTEQDVAHVQAMIRNRVTAPATANNTRSKSAHAATSSAVNSIAPPSSFQERFRCTGLLKVRGVCEFVSSIYEETWHSIMKVSKTRHGSKTTEGGNTQCTPLPDQGPSSATAWSSRSEIEGWAQRFPKVVIFAHHIDVLDGISANVQRMLSDLSGSIADEDAPPPSAPRKVHLSHIRIDGSTPGFVRQTMLSKFKTDPACLVAVIGITSCSIGVTMATASMCVFAEVPPDVAWLLQAEDRLHRPIDAPPPSNHTAAENNATGPRPNDGTTLDETNNASATPSAGGGTVAARRMLAQMRQHDVRSFVCLAKNEVECHTVSSQHHVDRNDEQAELSPIDATTTTAGGGDDEDELVATRALRLLQMRSERESSSPTGYPPPQSRQKNAQEKDSRRPDTRDAVSTTAASRASPTQNQCFAFAQTLVKAEQKHWARLRVGYSTVSRVLSGTDKELHNQLAFQAQQTTDLDHRLEGAVPDAGCVDMDERAQNEEESDHEPLSVLEQCNPRVAELVSAWKGHQSSCPTDTADADSDSLSFLVSEHTGFLHVFTSETKVETQQQQPEQHAVTALCRPLTPVDVAAISDHVTSFTSLSQQHTTDNVAVDQYAGGVNRASEESEDSVLPPQIFVLVHRFITARNGLRAAARQRFLQGPVTVAALEAITAKRLVTPHGAKPGIPNELSASSEGSSAKKRTDPARPFEDVLSSAACHQRPLQSPLPPPAAVVNPTSPERESLSTSPNGRKKRVTFVEAENAASIESHDPRTNADESPSTIDSVVTSARLPSASSSPHSTTDRVFDRYLPRWRQHQTLVQPPDHDVDRADEDDEGRNEERMERKGLDRPSPMDQGCTTQPLPMSEETASESRVTRGRLLSSNIVDIPDGCFVFAWRPDAAMGRGAQWHTGYTRASDHVPLCVECRTPLHVSVQATDTSSETEIQDENPKLHNKKTPSDQQSTIFSDEFLQFARSFERTLTTSAANVSTSSVGGGGGGARQVAPGETLPSARDAQLFCDGRCKGQYWVQRSGGALRDQLFRLEHGVCQACGLDCEAVVAELAAIPVRPSQTTPRVGSPRSTTPQQPQPQVPQASTAWSESNPFRRFGLQSASTSAAASPTPQQVIASQSPSKKRARERRREEGVQQREEQARAEEESSRRRIALLRGDDDAAANAAAASEYAAHHASLISPENERKEANGSCGFGDHDGGPVRGDGFRARRRWLEAHCPRFFNSNTSSTNMSLAEANDTSGSGDRGCDCEPKYPALVEALVQQPTSGRAWQADHIVPVASGGGAGTDVLWNMQTLCVVCHMDKTRAENRIARASMHGWRGVE